MLKEAESAKGTHFLFKRGERDRLGHQKNRECDGHSLSRPFEHKENTSHDTKRNRGARGTHELLGVEEG